MDRCNTRNPNHISKPRLNNSMHFEYDLKHSERLDSFLSSKIVFLSRNQLANMIKDGLVTVDGKILKPSFRLQYGNQIDVLLPKQEKLEIEAEDLNVPIIYEEDDFLIALKPQGMLTHPTGLTKSGTLVNAMLHHCKGKLSGMIGKERPGIVHRLDKGTSGLMVIAKTDFALKEFSKMFKNRTINKEYIAICKGYLSLERIVINAPIDRDLNHRWKMTIDEDGRESISKVEEICRLKEHTYIKIKLITGRTHQIRVHLSYIGHPVLGDQVYGGADSRFPVEYPYLHCGKLSFTYNGKEYDLSADPPKEFTDILSKLSLTTVDTELNSNQI
jgi:23S rRNA pseudouridine1911/1915/1917 synthase